MIRADRELLADLARMNSDVVPLAMQIMDDSATREEQQAFAERLIDLGTRLSHRARHTGIVIDGDAGELHDDCAVRSTLNAAPPDSASSP